MNTLLLPMPRPSPPAFVPNRRIRHGADTGTSAALQSAAVGEQWRADLEFVALLKACRPSRGLARLSELAGELRQRAGKDLADLLLWRDELSLCSLWWRGEMWLPRFQFRACDGHPKPVVREVMLELSGTLQPAALCQWFCEANQWLNGLAPAAVLDVNAPLVLQAARADRFAVD